MNDWDTCVECKREVWRTIKGKCEECLGIVSPMFAHTEEQESTENEQLRAIAQVVATDDTTWYDGLDQYCIFCTGEENFTDRTRFYHTDECIVTRARAIMQKSEK